MPWVRCRWFRYSSTYSPSAEPFRNRGLLLNRLYRNIYLSFRLICWWWLCTATIDRFIDSYIIILFFFVRVWLLVFTWAMCRHAVMFINIGRDDSNWVPFELTDGNKLIREHTRNWFYIFFYPVLLLFRLVFGVNILRFGFDDTGKILQIVKKRKERNTMYKIYSAYTGKILCFFLKIGCFTDIYLPVFFFKIPLFGS